MSVHVLLRFLRRAVLNLRRTPLPSLLAVLTISLAVFLGAAFALGVAGARGLLRSWGAEASLVVYLDAALPEADARAIGEHVRAENPELAVSFVDRGEALARLRVELGDLAPALDGLMQNPLPATLEIVPRGAPDAVALRALASRLVRIPGVSDVDFGREWLDKLEALGRGLRSVGAATLLVVVGAAVLVVANTIRLAVYARRDEIEIMKLVGATDAYVRAPFLVEGALQGLGGAALAAAGIAGMERWLWPRALSAFAFASGAPLPRLGLGHATLLFAAGAGVGLLGSWIAVGRFLRA